MPSSATPRNEDQPSFRVSVIPPLDTLPIASRGMGQNLCSTLLCCKRAKFSAKRIGGSNDTGRHSGSNQGRNCDEQKTIPLVRFFLCHVLAARFWL